jgi:predicted phage terminase large subunit-like protein
LKSDRSPLGSLVIEEKASGQSLIQSLKHEGFDVLGYPATTDKVTRVNASIPSVFHGRIRVPPPDYDSWVEEFIAECAAFSDDLSHPNDDQVDAFTQAEQVWRESID